MKLSIVALLLVGSVVVKENSAEETPAKALLNALDAESQKLFKYLGCYQDKQPAADRALRGRAGQRFQSRTDGLVYADFQPVNSPAICVAFCRLNNYQYAGVQFGYACYCGVSYDRYNKLSDATCNRPCVGNTDYACGGYEAFSAYEVLSYSPAGAVIKCTSSTLNLQRDLIMSSDELSRCIKERANLQTKTSTAVQVIVDDLEKAQDSLMIVHGELLTEEPTPWEQIGSKVVEMAGWVNAALAAAPAARVSATLIPCHLRNIYKSVTNVMDFAKTCSRIT